MGLHPAFFIVTVVGWIFAVLGVTYEDALTRDIGVLVAVAALAMGLVLESEAVKAWRAGRSVQSRMKAARIKEASGFEKLGIDHVHPDPSTAVAAGAANAVRTAPARAPGVAYGKTATSWEADFSTAPRPASPEPMVVAPKANGNGATHPASAPQPPAPPAPGAERLTRGMCGKCQSPITVSSRRPIRVTCPMCGHSKLLQ